MPSEIIVPTDFTDIGDMSIAADVSALIILPEDDVLTPEEGERVARVRRRLIDLGKAEVGSKYLDSLKAEIAYQIQGEGDFLLLRNPETRQRYSNWTEFREFLANALHISEATLGLYLRDVRLLREYIGVGEGQFAEVGGITVARHLRDTFTIPDGRSSPLNGDVRPKTKHFKDYLVERYAPRDDAGEIDEDVDQDELNRAYFWTEVAHDYRDPSAVNKPSAHLSAQADYVTGKPTFEVEELFSGDAFYGYKVVMGNLPYTTDDGTEVLGAQEEYVLQYRDKFIPPGVRDEIGRRLKAKTGWRSP